MSDTVRVARAALHFGEEPCISGNRGSGTIFFSGCALGCVFCQNAKISRHGYGKNIPIERLAEIFRELENEGAHNINLVTPTHYAKQILKALAIYRPGVPVIWNSSGYEPLGVVREVAPSVDVFLPDLKFVSSEISQKYSGHRDYFEIASKTICTMRASTGPAVFDEAGMVQKGTIVRHLILPGCTKDSLRALDFLKRLDTPISVMAQYTPMPEGAKKYAELGRPITEREYYRVVNKLMEDDGFTGWVQERESSVGEEFIPDFDGSGV